MRSKAKSRAGWSSGWSCLEKHKAGKLGQAGRGWPRLAEAGRGWPRLEAAPSLLWRWRGVSKLEGVASGRRLGAAVFHIGYGPGWP
eukprot:scaffold37549_cov39-Phaeocystis_antarctica.AAC.2